MKVFILGEANHGVGEWLGAAETICSLKGEVPGWGTVHSTPQPSFLPHSLSPFGENQIMKGMRVSPSTHLGCSTEEHILQDYFSRGRKCSAMGLAVTSGITNREQLLKKPDVNTGSESIFSFPKQF